MITDRFQPPGDVPDRPSQEDLKRKGEAQMERERSEEPLRPLSMWTVRVTLDMDVSADGPDMACTEALTYLGYCRPMTRQFRVISTEARLPNEKVEP